MNLFPLDIEVVGYVAAACGAILACLSLLLPSRSITRVSFAVGMAALAAEVLFATLSARAPSAVDAAFWQSCRMAALTVFPVSWLLFSLVFARGNRSEFLAQWKVALIIALGAPLVVAYVMPGELCSVVAASSQEEENFWFELGTNGMVLHALILCVCVVVLVNLERTFLAAVGMMRWRIKFIILGLGLLILMRIYTASQKILYHGWSGSLDVGIALALIAASVFVVWSVARCGVGEADVYPSRRVILGSVTFSLVGIYLLLVGALAKGVSVWGGASALPFRALIILVGFGLLGVLFLSDRARLSVAQVLSRHFRRPSYDYRDIWQRFTERAASAVEPHALAGIACKFISELYQTLSVTLWTVDPGRHQASFAGSTTLSDEEGRAVLARAPLDTPAWTALQGCNEVIDLAKPPSVELKPLQHLCPVQFTKNGGDRFILPLRSRDTLVGLLALSDRVDGRDYTAEERDLLRTLGVEIASQLLNLELLERRSDEREIQALQTMATFFAHDLKNTGSTLSLTLQNLRRRYGDPEFRSDALKAVSKCVDHIGNVVDGLGALRGELNLNLRPCELNPLVEQTLSELGAALGTKVAVTLKSVPRVMMDPDQIKKVLVNLLLNARDAISSGDRIELRTGTVGHWVVLEVEDSGCGMSPEFVRHSLFRPFQTTKKKGLGVGMFQSRTITAAHGGRIEVESQVDLGTTFRVLLPIQEGAR